MNIYTDEKKSFKNVETKGARSIACSVEMNKDVDITTPRMMLFNAQSKPEANPLNIRFSSLSQILQVCQTP